MSDMVQQERAANPVAGAFWMVVTGILFVCVTAVVKYVGNVVPAPQSAFLRYALGLVFLLPALGALRRTRWTPRVIRLSALRGATHSLGVMLWFYAMTQISIAEVTAMNYLSPVYVTLLAALFLGERLAMRRIIAVLVALLGALIILRPGIREVENGHLAMLGTAVAFAFSYLIAKIMSDEVEPVVVVSMLSVMVTIGLAPFAWAVWVTPSLAVVGWMFLVACFATAGHLTMTLAFREAPLTVTQPMTFLQLIWAAALGAVVFGEATDVWVLVGGGVILGSVSFITWREAMLKRRAITPGPFQTKV
jgi:drug/metabolite transporter (DMT)-like permease